MMQRCLISQIQTKVSQPVRLCGFVQAVRDQGSIVFFILRDVGGTVQCVITRESRSFQAIKTIPLESVLEVMGTVKTEAQAPGGLEIAVQEVVILSHAQPELPIPVVEKSGAETDQAKRLDWRWIDLRKPQNLLVFKVWTLMEHAFRTYWTQNGYLEIHSPKFMSTPSESGAELFEVKYFGRKAYLAQSPQFYKQMAMASGFERVFEVGPVFRANPSFTSRHDTEFTGYDAEISYIQSHQDVMDEEQKALAYVLSQIKKSFGEQIEELYGREVIVPTLPFPQVTMAQAKEILSARGVPSEVDGDLSPEEERQLSAYIAETYGHEFVFVTDYPAKVRAFYHMRHEDNHSLTKSFDLLWNGLEITTGAQREHRYTVLVEQAKEKGLGVGPLSFYLDFFKYGCPPHGGFGLGPSRVLMKLLGVSNVRDVTYLYRGVKRLTP